MDSAMLGLGVMIRMLSEEGSGETSTAVKHAIGKRITSAVLDKRADVLRLGLEDGTTLSLWDGGQSCCEQRYMHTDDDLESFVGSRILSVQTLEAPDVEDPDDKYHDTFHEITFLNVITDGGTLVCSTHNIHNGYYGGFFICASLKPNAG